MPKVILKARIYLLKNLKMVYKRYIKSGTKLCGPYYYKSYRAKDGKVISKYLPDYKPPKKHKILFLFLGLIFVVFLLLVIGNLNYFLRTTGKVTEKLEASLSSFDFLKILMIISLIFIIVLGIRIIKRLVKRKPLKYLNNDLKKEYKKLFKSYYKFDKLKNEIKKR